MNRDWWKGKRVCVTGGHGFLGTHLTHALQQSGARVSTARSVLVDLSDMWQANRYFDNFPSLGVVFHLAAKVGGIGYNQSHPAEILHNNLLVDTNVVHAVAQRSGCKLICVGSTCAYPAHAPTPIREESFWQGEPEPTNAAYAHAKRTLYANLVAHHAQYGLNFAYLVLANLYGEGQSDDAQNSHVIPALVRKVLDRSTPTISAWGTGHAIREFLHVSDAVNALVLAAERETPPEPINIGGTGAYAIQEVLQCIQGIAGDRREVEWNTSRPDGQASRQLDWSRAHALLGYEPQMSFMHGLGSLLTLRMQEMQSV